MKGFISFKARVQNRRFFFGYLPNLQISKMSTEAELLQLIDRDIADGRRHLQDSHTNLEKVAAYCEGNYLQVGQKL